jgi:hypothetical protein
MEHSESRVKVYSTTDYQRFRMIEGNRPLNEGKIKKIIKDIEDGIDVLEYYPIQVYERGNLLDIDDGQHRFYIARKLRRPVHYILMRSTLHLSEIAKVNSNVEKWNSKDFINCYVQLNNENYVQLRDFLDKYGLSTTLSVQLLEKGNPDLAGLGGGSEKFQRGEFEVHCLEEADKLAAVATKFSGFKGWKSRSFFIALYKIMVAEKINIKDLVSKVVKNIDKLEPREGYKGYIENLESIYNLGRKDRVIIFE